MRQGNNNNHNNNNRRQRGRNNRRGNNQPNRNQVFDSNGPNVRVRGNAQQVMEKYLTLARDAQAAGNHVLAEAYFQHGEHYLRIHEANQAVIEEARARKQAQRDERQNKTSAASPENEQPEQPAAGEDASAVGEAEVIMAEATVEITEPEPAVDLGQQDQPDLAGVEIIGESPEAMSLIPESSVGDEQPSVGQGSLAPL